MCQWQQNLPQRLSAFNITDVQLFQLRPGACRAKWTYEFIAALPPPARQRGLPKDMVVLPGERVRVSTTVRSDFELAADGRIAKQIEAVVDGYDIPATISRYEFLTARRLADPPPVWYWKVLQATTIEEADVLYGGQATDDQLQTDFQRMVARNLIVGFGIGYILYNALKFSLLYLKSVN
jgi:hypothetical protein